MNDKFKKPDGDRLNEGIKAKAVSLISSDGKNLGIVTKKEALKMAREANLDLYCMTPNEDTPTCKLLDYGKMKYAKSRKERENRKKQVKTTSKEVQLSYNIGDADLMVRVKNTRKFIMKENATVNVVMRVKGRMITHSDLCVEVMNRFYAEVEDIAKLEKAPSINGNTISMVLKPKELK